MGVFKKIGAVISRPSEFFDDAIAESIAPAFAYAAVIFAIHFILLAPVLLVAGIFIETPAFLLDLGLGTAEIALLLVLLLILGYLVVLIGTFISAAIFHLWSLLWGAIGDYADSYKAVVYAATPQALLGWIPGINVIALVWSWILLVIAVAKLHNFSTARAIWMVVILLILCALLGVGTSLVAMPA